VEGTLLLRSLSSRTILIGTLIGFAVVLLQFLLLSASAGMQSSFQWAIHSQQVLQATESAMSNLREAESGQRGFLLTHDASFLDGFQRHIDSADNQIAIAERLTGDNPVQRARVASLRQLIDRRIALMKRPVDLARQGQFTLARQSVSNGKGRDQMQLAEVQAGDVLDAERKLLDDRADQSERRAIWNRQVVIVGSPIIIGLIVALMLIVARGIQGPVHAILKVMRRLGDGDREARIEKSLGSTEFNRLAEGYNSMANHLSAAIASQRESDTRLIEANEELRRHSEMLHARSEAIELLGNMAHRMQAARTDEELSAIVATFLPQVLLDAPGALFAHNNSRNLLTCMARWGEPRLSSKSFAPAACWALRLGQSHYVSAPGADVVCEHVDDKGMKYHCEPLLAGGEVIGLLYFERLIESDERFRLTAITENIASALVNHRLQRDLREQTIRDPLTGLFNRRYMEEALGLEIARAARGSDLLCLVMCDVDHFKRFNDEFGHDSGDALLKAIAAEMQRHFRDGDVICRFGGEEFTIIAPGATVASLAARVEHLRTEVQKVAVRHGGRTLGSITMSFGVAQWDPGMHQEAAILIRKADEALYRAKREGRNRVVLADRVAA